MYGQQPPVTQQNPALAAPLQTQNAPPLQGGAGVYNLPFISSPDASFTIGQILAANRAAKGANLPAWLPPSVRNSIVNNPSYADGTTPMPFQPGMVMVPQNSTWFPPGAAQAYYRKLFNLPSQSSY